LHITPGPRPQLTAFRRCPFCQHEAHLIGHVQEWYDTMWHCCRCGDGWAGGEMLPRPFRPGWRPQAIREAQRAWWTALLDGLSVADGTVNPL
jgi:hypothetical protein